VNYQPFGWKFIIAVVVLATAAVEVYAGVATLHLGGPGFTVVSGDFDGDGKADPAVYEEASGNWYVAQSSRNYSIATINLGAPGSA